jgi:hypothetical protein
LPYQTWRPSRRLPAPPLQCLCCSPPAIAAGGRRQERPPAHRRWRQPDGRSPLGGTCPGYQQPDPQLERLASRSWTPATCSSASASSFWALR